MPPVPDLSKLTEGTAAFRDASAKLYRWLRQEGFSENQIMAQDPLEWSALKTSLWDKGLGAVKTALKTVGKWLVEEIPAKAGQWVNAAIRYKVPGGEVGVKTLKAAWSAFTEENAIADPTASMFNRFMKAYTESDADLIDVGGSVDEFSCIDSQSFS